MEAVDSQYDEADHRDSEEDTLYNTKWYQIQTQASHLEPNSYACKCDTSSISKPTPKGAAFKILQQNLLSMHASDLLRTLASTPNALNAGNPKNLAFRISGFSSFKWSSPKPWISPLKILNRYRIMTTISTNNSTITLICHSHLHVDSDHNISHYVPKKSLNDTPHTPLSASAAATAVAGHRALTEPRPVSPLHEEDDLRHPCSSRLSLPHGFRSPSSFPAARH
ncbi:hypothetical protein Syun_006930 [Stephania yunnanensis]|uniref:Uncharacterized protein n=1 Tax=Stephania yunnanensis TaxID=152371 RepID=A0AAP0L0Y9_9MAGN